MKHISALIVFLGILLTALFLFVPQSNAIVDPLSVANNRVGVHILFPSELGQAAQFVNANGGDWGYVTIPIQAGDKDIVKWQTFMNQAKQLHVIPIIRLATEGDYFNTATWRRPQPADVLDFANFLNSLDWPTKNRYVIIFNEVNRADEWNGNPDPAEYADILSYAVTVFKSRSDDFFIISSGFDNAAATVSGQGISEYSFMRQMNAEVPGVFGFIDGLGSHSYPNPGFSQSPQSLGPEGVASFRYERELARQLSGKDLPVFITETGWSRDGISDQTAANYYQQAFANVWSDSSVVAVTPFLLFANSDPFKAFSLLQDNMSQSEEYKAIFGMAKIKGVPALSATYLQAALPHTDNQKVPTKNFDKTNDVISSSIILPNSVKTLLKWVLKI